MKLPATILAKTLARFDSLIADGRNVLQSAKDVAPVIEEDVGWDGNRTVTSPGYKEIDPEKFVEWRTKTATLLNLVISSRHIHHKSVQEIASLQCSYGLMQAAVSLLRGIKDDLEKGFLDDMAGAIEAEIACDYMGQAEQLLADSHRGKFDYVPAAVLAGAVLENALRKLCSQQQSPIAQQDAKGNHKTLGPLIQELKKAGVFNEAKAKQLQAWADIRNLAAHGEFNQFKRTDVEPMIAGINSFLADYLK
jgi:hypothetical protein